MGYKDLEENRAYNRAYYEAHKEELKRKARIRVPLWQKANRDHVNAGVRRRRAANPEARLLVEKRARLKLKRTVLRALGGVCACCGEHRLEFLTIDHIDGGGCRHRGEYSRGSGDLYRVVREEGFPKDRYQVLCHNCNWGKHVRGVCPHQGNPSPKKVKWPYSRRSKLKFRKEVLKRLGGRCACCGEDQLEFLTIDHINEDGAEHRRKVGKDICTYLRKHDYPPGFQVLCLNCNRSKHFGGGICVHCRDQDQS